MKRSLRMFLNAIILAGPLLGTAVQAEEQAMVWRTTSFRNTVDHHTGAI